MFINEIERLSSNAARDAADAEYAAALDAAMSAARDAAEAEYDAAYAKYVAACAVIDAVRAALSEERNRD